MTEWNGTECVEAPGGRTRGYGYICVGGKQYLAHRIAYEREHGEIPEGLVIDHLCRNRGCINPDHMEPVTIGENVRRGRNSKRDQTHCQRGHEFTEDNIYRTASRPTHRLCKTCAREKIAERDYQDRRRRGIPERGRRKAREFVLTEV